jgi:hypothetical protein
MNTNIYMFKYHVLMEIYICMHIHIYTCMEKYVHIHIYVIPKIIHYISRSFIFYIHFCIRLGLCSYMRNKTENRCCNPLVVNCLTKHHHHHHADSSSLWNLWYLGMYINTYIYICICMHMHVYIYTCTRIYVFTCIHSDIYIHILPISKNEIY